MLDQFFRRPRVRARLRANPLGAWIEAYVDYLDKRGHPLGTIQQYVQAVEHFGVWLDSEQIAVEAVSRTAVNCFLHDHLPQLSVRHSGPGLPQSGPSRLGPPAAGAIRRGHSWILTQSAKFGQY